MSKTTDSIQKRFTDYASDLSYDDLTPVVIHAAKARIIDTLGVLVRGFFGEPCKIARDVAAQMPNPDGATIIGTRMKTMLDMAAFVNATAARYAEMNDTYHQGKSGAHPSDMILPLLGVAEYARAAGREFITSVVLAYEIYLRIGDVFQNRAFDHTNNCCLGTAVGTAKLLNLGSNQVAHCISMAVVPNVVLRQVRTGHLTMFKGVASGQAGRAGVFAALLAQAGMEGPHLPFEGKAGWCDHVNRARFSIDAMGGNGTPFKIPETLIKNRASAGVIIAYMLAAEKIAPLEINDVQYIVVEAHRRAKENWGTGDPLWHPDSKETADHSIPYITAAALMDGTVTPQSYDDAHLHNPELHALMQKIEVVENEEFTAAFFAKPQQHRARTTVVKKNGEQLVGEAGGDEHDLAAAMSDTQIEQKFLELTEHILGSKRARGILSSLWRLEEMQNIAEIPPAFVFC